MPDDLTFGPRERSRWRDLVRGRGPDAGRDIDHLKARSTSPQVERLLTAAEAQPLALSGAVDLTNADGELVFLTGTSTTGGDDVTG